MTTRIIAFANQKGGVAKTTTSVNVAAGLTYLNYKVLLVDMDPQGNATLACIGPRTLEMTVYDVLRDPSVVLEVIVPGKRFDVLPADIDLSGAEVELVGEVGGQLRLRRALRDLPYDYIIIDSPPSLGILTINSLAAATEVMVPVAPGVFGLKGIERLENTIAKVRENLDHPVEITGVVVTMAERTNVAGDVLELVRGRFGDKAFETTIPKNVKIEEAHSRAESIFEYEINSTGAVAYRDLVKEIVGRGD